MAQKKALVYGSDGEIEQLQPGDNIQDQDFISQTNAEATSIPKGTPVYTFGVDSVKKANAAAIATAKVLGLVLDTTIAASAAGQIQDEGVIVLTAAQWDAVAGTSGGLTAGTKYRLGGAGLITSNIPSSGIDAPVGIALSTTELNIKIERVIRL